MEYIAFDCHKRYTYAVVEDEDGHMLREARVPHEPGALGDFLSRCEPGSPVVGAVGRHLAEAAYWVLKRSEPCRDPKFCPGRSGA